MALGTVFIVVVGLLAAYGVVRLTKVGLSVFQLCQLSCPFYMCFGNRSEEDRF